MLRHTLGCSHQHTLRTTTASASYPPNTTIDITSPFCTPNVRPLCLLVDKLPTTPTLTIDITSPFCTPNLRSPCLPVDQFPTTPTLTITNHPLPGFSHLTDTLLQTTKTANYIHSSPSIAPTDNWEDVFTDEALDTQDVECHIDALPPLTPTLTIDNALTINNALTIDDVLSHPLNLRPLVLLDSFPTLLSTNTNTNQSGSVHPTDVFAQKPRLLPPG
ncbi:hypothetical protein EDB19DRAFT_1386941 [Suillus lakei]|nr:hypothetical protein EDB19DRAFT_1386941 [Suillus lakei]